MLELRTLTVEMGTKILDETRAIFLIGALEPLIERRDLGVSGQADHQLPALGAVERVVGNVPVPQTVVRAGCRQGISLLGLPRGFQCGHRIAVETKDRLACRKA